MFLRRKMVRRNSAGLLVYRLIDNVPEVLLVHPGGPFFVNKDAGAWTIPKGEPEEDEDLLAAARREFTEETGAVVDGDFIRMESVTQRSGKVVFAWAVANSGRLVLGSSNTFSIEWPPHSGAQGQFPEVDKVEWFDMATARLKINPVQISFLDQLENLLANH